MHSIGWRNPTETCKHQPTEIEERFGGFLRSTLSSWPRQRPYRSSSPASSCQPIPQLLLGHLKSKHKPYRNCQMKGAKFRDQSAGHASLAVLMSAVAISVGSFRD